MVMATDVSAIRTYFTKLGLETEIADIYLALHTHGPQSISQLSRNAHVERTRIYRLIDQLMDSNLIEVEPQQKRGIIKAAPIANLHILIAQKEQELKSLQDELSLIEQVFARNSLGTPVSHIQVFESTGAAKQIRYNMLNAQSEVLSFLHRDLYEEFDKPFAIQWTTSADRQKLSFRSIYNRKFSPENLAIATDTPHPDSWDARITSGDSPHIDLNLFIYDDVIATLQWRDNATYGLEVHDDKFAKCQRVLFESVWQQSQEF